MVDGTSETAKDTAASGMTLEERLHGDVSALSDFAKELSLLRQQSSGSPQRSDSELPGSDVGGQPAYASGRVNADPDNVEQGLAKLVLTLIELIRQLLEKQAIRRMEAGSLTDDEIERMGETFLKLEQKMEELKAAFGLEGEELNLSLGPLGNLLPEK